MHRRHLAVALFVLALCAASCGPPDNPKSAHSDSTPAASEQPDNEAVDDAKTDNGRADYDEMVRVLKLTDEETKQLKAAFDGRETVISRWMEDKGKQLEEFEIKMIDAAKAKDLGSVQTWKQKAEPLRKELVDSVEGLKVKIREALPEKKRLEWEAHQLAERLLKLMDSLKLSDQQKSNTRAKAEIAARESAKESNPQAAGFLKAEREVETNVLTPQQREQYEAVKKKNPLRSLKD